MFVLSQVLDCEPIAINDKNQVRLPREVVDTIGEDWIWEVYFDGKEFECTTMWKEGDEMVICLSDHCMKELGWKIGETVTWETSPVDEEVTGEGPSTNIHIYGY